MGNLFPFEFSVYGRTMDFETLSDFLTCDLLLVPFLDELTHRMSNLLEVPGEDVLDCSWVFFCI